jgi:predicted transcriptional regulator
VYALAKAVPRNHSSVHTDIGKVEEHGVVQRTPEYLC